MLGWGRPVHYVSWPAANPDNLRGSTDPIFPFAHEAALVVGADPGFTLSEELRSSGCRQRRIHTFEQLRRALWSTPRWGPQHWLDLDLQALVAVAGHELLRHDYEEFVRPGWHPESDLDGLPIALADDAGRTRREELAECRASLEHERRRADSAEAQLASLYERYLEAVAPPNAID